jgi:hypothetical protein
MDDFSSEPEVARAAMGLIDDTEKQGSVSTCHFGHGMELTGFDQGWQERVLAQIVKDGTIREVSHVISGPTRTSREHFDVRLEEVLWNLLVY